MAQLRAEVVVMCELVRSAAHLRGGVGIMTGRGKLKHLERNLLHYRIIPHGLLWV
jgi:hypothetical protein